VADQAAQAVRDRRALSLTLIVVSGGFLAATVTPLELGAALVDVDTETPGAGERAVTAVRSRLR